MTAFAALVARHERRVRVFLLRLCGSASLADDLAQETFLKAWRKASSYRGEGGYQGWLLRIAWRTFLSEARKPRLVTAPPAAGDFACAVSNDTALALDLSRAMQQLDLRERAVAMLCFAEGYSHSQAAAILEMPLGTTKSVLERARSKLVGLLEGSVA